MNSKKNNVCSSSLSFFASAASRSIVLLTLIAAIYTHTADFFDSNFFDEGNIFDNPALDQMFVNQTWVGPSDQRARPTPAGAVGLLNDLGLTDILEEEYLYLKTSPVNSRNILNMPLFIPYPTSLSPDFLGSHLFFNVTTRKKFTQHSTNISSYLGFQQPSLVNKIDKIFEQVQQVQPTFIYNADDLLLFKNFTVQEHQLGLMLQGNRSYRGFTCSYALPVYYQERNFYVTPHEQEDLERRLGRLSSAEQASFQKDHLISDRIGWGDLRLQLGRDFRYGSYKANLGLFTTLPLSVALVRGIKGNYFVKKHQRPELDLQTVLATNMPPHGEQDAFDAQQAIEDFGLGILDHLAANVLETSLGNNRHMSVGLTLTTKTLLSTFIKRPWASAFKLKSVISLEYLFPACEDRFFVQKKDEDAFASRNFDDPNQAASNLQFLEQEFVDFFYPYVFEAKVHPGVVFSWTSGIHYEGKRWGIMLASDSWLKSEESLSTINAPMRNLSRLDIEKAIAPWCYQSKLIGGVYTKIFGKNHDYIFSIQTDYTLMATGIGNDFTVSLNLTGYF